MRVIESGKTELPKLRKCLKRPIAVHARKMAEPFVVIGPDGSSMKGVTGDYLMKGVKGELYVCQQSVFEASYAFLEDGEE